MIIYTSLFNQILFSYSKIKTKESEEKKEGGSGREEQGGREERESDQLRL